MTASSRRLAVTGPAPWPGGWVYGMALCPDGTVALSTGNPEHRIYRATLAADGASCSLQVWAGAGGLGYADGPGAQARFTNPSGLTALRGGSLVVADFGNHRIRLVSPAGEVSTLAGSGVNGNADGPAAAASFCGPRDVAVRRCGTVLVTSNGHTVRAIAPGANTVRTLAGQPGERGIADGPPTAAAGFFYPDGVAVLPGGGTLVCDNGNYRLRLLSASDAAVRTVAGSGERACTDGAGAGATFAGPMSVAVDCAGAVVVADSIYNPQGFAFTTVLRRVDAVSGAVSTLRDRAGARLEFAGHAQIAVDARGRLLVASRRGLHLVALAPAGLAPGYFPGHAGLMWRPTRAAFVALRPRAQAATRTVLLLAARAAAAEAAGRRQSRRRQLLLALPVLPLELWHLILGLVEPDADLGGSG